MSDDKLSKNVSDAITDIINNASEMKKEPKDPEGRSDGTNRKHTIELMNVNGVKDISYGLTHAVLREQGKNQQRMEHDLAIIANMKDSDLHRLMETARSGFHSGYSSSGTQDDINRAQTAFDVLEAAVQHNLPSKTPGRSIKSPDTINSDLVKAVVADIEKHSEQISVHTKNLHNQPVELDKPEGNGHVFTIPDTLHSGLPTDRSATSKEFWDKTFITMRAIHLALAEKAGFMNVQVAGAGSTMGTTDYNYATESPKRLIPSTRIKKKLIQATTDVESHPAELAKLVVRANAIYAHLKKEKSTEKSHALPAFDSHDVQISDLQSPPPVTGKLKNARSEIKT